MGTPAGRSARRADSAPLLESRSHGATRSARCARRSNKAPPSQAAQTAYLQAILYANAVEKAGTFYPPEVIKALEGFEFEGFGPSKSLYRAEDHQVFKDIYVVRGKAPSKMANEFDLLEIVAQVPRKDVEYDPKMLGGELGPYVPKKA